jgi:flagellar protein FliL
VVLLGLVAGAGFMGWLPLPGLSPRKAPEASPAESAGEKEEMGPVVKLKPLVINLRDESGRSYLKTTIVLELAKKNGVEEVNKMISSLTDIAILTLGDKRLDELKPPESKESLKQELLTKMNQQFPTKPIRRVYFDEFLYE